MIYRFIEIIPVSFFCSIFRNININIHRKSGTVQVPNSKGNGKLTYHIVKCICADGKTGFITRIKEFSEPDKVLGTYKFQF